MTESPTTPKRTILILEDERQLAKAIRDAFVERGYHPIVVATVEEGVRQLENLKNVDVVWLDHYLLGAENGLDFVVQMKNNPDWKEIPIFVVSNTASSTNIRSYLELGVSNYYTKADYDINQIINDIGYVIDKKTK
ncbi:MAG: response regulator [bacterium]|nr:response regulator [bacterium]